MAPPVEYQLITLNHGTCPLCNGSATATSDGWDCQDPRCGTGFVKAEMEVAAFAPMILEEVEPPSVYWSESTWSPNTPTKPAARHTDPRRTFESYLLSRSSYSEKHTLNRNHPSNHSADAAEYLSYKYGPDPPRSSIPDIRVAGINIEVDCETHSIIKQRRVICLKYPYQVRELEGRLIIVENYPTGSYSFGRIMLYGQIEITDQHFDLKAANDRIELPLTTSEMVLRREIEEQKRNFVLDTMKHVISLNTEERPTFCGQCRSCLTGHNEPPHCAFDSKEVSMDQPGCDKHFRR